MLQSLLNIGVLVITGAFLKPRFKGLLILIGFWIVLWFLHSEYLNYVDYSGNTDFVLHSSILKVVLILLSSIIYGLSVERSIFLQNNSYREFAYYKHKGDIIPVDKTDDGFNFLRNKEKLLDASEQLLGTDKK